MLERFVSQLERNGAPTCKLCGGKIMNGLNCTCAAHAMWLYRASQGAIRTSACHVRDLTDDCSGGTRLRQMQTVSVAEYGITKGMLYLPAKATTVLSMVATGRYGAHWNISYDPVIGSGLDAFRGEFRGNHDIYLSGPGLHPETTRVGDPGAAVFRDWPNHLLVTAAGRLDLDGHGTTLNEESGGGKVYAYVTPADPFTKTTLYHFFIKGRTPVFNFPETDAYRFLNSGSGPCRRRTVNGHLWLQIVKPGSPVNGKWLHAGPTIDVTPI